jgi:hypothetical protein
VLARDVGGEAASTSGSIGNVCSSGSSVDIGTIRLHR